MSMNHDLTIRLAHDHQGQMLAEASHRQRHQPRRPARQAPRTATQITRGLAATISSARVVAGRHVTAGITRWAVTDARES